MSPSPVSAYSYSLVNTLVSFGLLLLYMPFYRDWNWHPPFQIPKFIITIYFLSNLLLIVVPFFPPVAVAKTYTRLPYWVMFIFFCFLEVSTSLIDIFGFSKIVAPGWRFYGIIEWYRILVYMEHLASEEERILSPTRVGYSGRWYLSVCIPSSTQVCCIAVDLSSRLVNYYI